MGLTEEEAGMDGVIEGQSDKADGTPMTALAVVAS